MGPRRDGDETMARATIYSLDLAGIDAFDVFTPAGRWCGLVLRKPDGSWRHRYTVTGSKGSARKFPTVESALDNLHARRVKRGLAV